MPIKLLLCLLCLLGIANAQQAPAPDAAMAGLDTVADHPSSLYRFERHHMVSEDGQRTYRIDISIPRKPEPNAGYPVLYMLDGNSAMAMLNEQDLAMLAAEHPPVLVAIGYDIAGRLDVNARSYDYTPPVFDNSGKPVGAPVVRGRVGGGADIFLQFINTHIKPLVRARANIDSRREYLWGHSYGGLFTLHTLFSQPNAFARYITGDPSAWWYDGALMREWERFDQNRAVGKRVVIMIGTKPRARAQAERRPQRSGSNDLSSYLRDAGREIAEGLRQAGVDASYETFPEYGHGEMSRVSLERALRIATEP